MGIVWEAYHTGVPLLGVPGITLDKRQVPTSAIDVLFLFHVEPSTGLFAHNFFPLVFLLVYTPENIHMEPEHALLEKGRHPRLESNFSFHVGFWECNQNP